MSTVEERLAELERRIAVLEAFRVQSLGCAALITRGAELELERKPARAEA